MYTLFRCPRFCFRNTVAHDTRTRLSCLVKAWYRNDIPNISGECDFKGEHIFLSWEKNTNILLSFLAPQL